MESLQINPNNSKSSTSSQLALIRLCRLCLASLDTMIELFSVEAKLMKINDKLKEFCHIGISQADIGPKTICFTCLNEVNRFADFYRRVQDNQKLLALSCKTEDGSVGEGEIVVFQSSEIVKDEVETHDTLLVEEECHLDDEDDGNVEIAIVDETDECNELEEHFSDDCTYNEIEIEAEALSGDDDENISLSHVPEEKTIADSQILPDDNPRHETDTERPEDSNQSDGDVDSAPQNDLTEHSHEPCTNTADCNEETEKRRAKKRLALDKPIRDFFDLHCDKCNKNFQTFQSIKNHMIERHGERFFFVCCNREFYRRDAVMDHINSHLNPKKYTCEVCNQICKSKVTLKVHMKQHIPKDQQPFACEICGCRFAVRSQLKSHMNTHLSNDQRKFVCEECGKAFAFKFVLDKHKKRMHIGQKNFMCEICAKSFVDKVTLQTHKRTHDTSLPRLECPKCNALLKSRKTLQVHMRVHETTQYSCELCQKMFSTKNGLLNHMQYYHVDKKYPCETCGRVFKKALNLKEHMATHTGEVLYNCEYCDKTFNAKANRYAHIKKVHPAEWSNKQKLRWRVEDDKLAE